MVHLENVYKFFLLLLSARNPVYFVLYKRVTIWSNKIPLVKKINDKNLESLPVVVTLISVYLSNYYKQIRPHVCRCFVFCVVMVKTTTSNLILYPKDKLQRHAHLHFNQIGN